MLQAVVHYGQVFIMGKDPLWKGVHYGQVVAIMDKCLLLTDVHNRHYGQRFIMDICSLWAGACYG